MHLVSVKLLSKKLLLYDYIKIKLFHLNDKEYLTRNLLNSEAAFKQSNHILSILGQPWEGKS